MGHEASHRPTGADRVAAGPVESRVEVWPSRFPDARSIGAQDLPRVSVPSLCFPVVTLEAGCPRGCLGHMAPDLTEVAEWPDRGGTCFQ